MVMMAIAVGLTALYGSQIGMVAAGAHLGKLDLILYLSQLIVWVWIAMMWRWNARQK